MKKLILSIAVLVLILVTFFPTSSAEASGNGQWDYISYQYLFYRSAFGWYDTLNVQSTGGGVRIEGDENKVAYELWESDPGANNDDYIGRYVKSAGSPYGIFNVNGFVDGSNNRAELYVKTYEDARWVKFWD